MKSKFIIAFLMAISITIIHSYECGHVGQDACDDIQRMAHNVVGIEQKVDYLIAQLSNHSLPIPTFPSVLSRATPRFASFSTSLFFITINILCVAKYSF